LDQFVGLPVDVLGRVYERSLTKRIAVDGRGVAVFDEPKAIKSSGVYYTPPLIVDYIVRHTVGELLDGMTTETAQALKIVDPACGAGSFLIAAYQFLLDWYRDRYATNAGPDGRDGSLYRDARGRWRLTGSERARILVHHIHGVEIDCEAAAVTRLALLLKLLEGEPQTPISQQLPLPEWTGNIKRGNALIGPDFGELAREPGGPQQRFDWDTEFPRVFSRENGGFDVVLGNPPYLNIRLVTQTQGQSVKRYFKKRYRCATGGYDLYVLFVEKSLEILRSGGRFGMILPNKLATLGYAEQCRSLMLGRTTIHCIADVSEMEVFRGTGVYPYIVTWEKSPPARTHRIRVLHAKSAGDLKSGESCTTIVQSSLSPENGLTIHGTLDVESRVPTALLSARSTLHSGTTGLAAQRMAAALVEKDAARDEECFDFIVTGNIDRYAITLGNVRFMKRTFARPVLPAGAENLSQRKRRLFRESKIVIAGMTKSLEAALNDGDTALGVQVYAAADLADDPHYVLGILNSRLMSYLFRQRFHAKHLAGGYLAINKAQLGKLPIRQIDFSDQQEKARHDALVQLVKRMLSLQRQLAQAENACRNQRQLARRIETTDLRIDGLVNELYGLTDEEIARIEPGNRAEQS